MSVNTAPGWYPDPYNPALQRYWDGQAWGPHTQPVAGPPIPPRKKRHPVLITLGVVAVIVIAFFAVAIAVGGKDTASDTASSDPAFLDRATYRPVSERDLQLIVKDPEKASGDKIVIFARVAQADSATGSSTIRVNVRAVQESTEFGDNAVVVVDDPSILEPIVADDQVRLYVTVEGAQSYDTQIGGRTTAPKFTAAIIEPI